MSGKQKFNTFELFKYICICTVGSGVLFGPQNFYSTSGKNAATVNFALFANAIIVQFLAQCYAELKRMVPEEGGDFLYIEKFFSSLAGTAYAALTIAIVVPGINSMFCKLLLEIYDAEKSKLKFLYSLIICAAALPIQLIPIKARKGVSKFVSIAQQITMVVIMVSLPLALGLRKSNKLISTTKKLKPAPIGFTPFFKTFADIYFIFCGFYEGNSLPSNQIGDLSIPYIISSTGLYVIYAIILNLFYLIYKNEEADISYRNVLGFIPGDAGKYLYYVLASVIFIAPFFSSAFMCTNNSSYLINKYGLAGKINYLIMGIVGVISYGFTFMEIGLIMGLLSIFMIASTIFSVYGIFVYCKRNPGYKKKLPNAYIYCALAGALAILASNATFVVIGIIDKIRK